MARRAWLLGAGFSKCISSVMPLMNELGTAVCERISREKASLALVSPPERAVLERGQIPLGDLEVWLTTLASPQPFLDEGELLRRRSLAVDLTGHIAEEVTEAQRGARVQPPPDWLVALVALWHHSRDAVLTLNYDTLVESCLVGLRLVAGRAEHEWRSIAADVYRDYPQLVPTSYGRWGRDAFAGTFELLKLHGSVSWYRLRGGGQIYRVDEALAAWDSVEPELPSSLASPLRGATRAILLPQADKTSGYTDPVIANLWRRGRECLGALDELVLFGYSLPATDTSVSALLAQTVGVDVPVTVIDPNAADVRARLRRLGLGAKGSDIDPCSTQLGDAVKHMIDTNAVNVISDVSLLQAPYYVAARDQYGVVTPVVRSRSAGKVVHLSLDTAPLEEPAAYVSAVGVKALSSVKEWKLTAADGRQLQIMGFHEVPGARESSNIVLDVIASGAVA